MRRSELPKIIMLYRRDEKRAQVRRETERIVGQYERNILRITDCHN